MSPLAFPSKLNVNYFRSGDFRIFRASMSQDVKRIRISTPLVVGLGLGSVLPDWQE